MLQNFDQAYVFGDSLSDTGNFLGATGGGFPTFPYETGRFTNFSNEGAGVWVDYLTDELDINVNPFITGVNPNTGELIFDLSDANDGINFAIGGATSGNTGALFLGLEQQINAFNEELVPNQSAEETFADDQFFIWTGANDYFSFIDPTSTNDDIKTNFPETGRERREAVIEVVDINIKGAIDDIIDAGGENIVVFNLPDLDQTPLGQNLTRQDQRQLRRLTNIHNRRLSRLARRTERANPNVNIVEVDINDLFDEVLGDPDEFGFTNVTDNYSGIDLYTEIQQPPLGPLGVNPDGFFFFDSVHPTKAGHELVAELVMDQLIDEGLIID